MNKQIYIDIRDKKGLVSARIKAFVEQIHSTSVCNSFKRERGNGERKEEIIRRFVDDIFQFDSLFFIYSSF